MEKRNQLNEYRKKIADLNAEESAAHDLHLKKIAKGEIMGPPTHFYSLDKPFLVNYSDEAIKGKIPQKNIYDYIFDRNKDRGNLPAYYYFNNKKNFYQLKKDVDKCALSFIENGVKENNVVTLCMPNTPEALIAILALNKIGAVASMVNAKSSAEELKNCINECKSDLLIVIDKCYDGIQSIKNETCLKKIVNVHPSDSMNFPLNIGYKMKYKKEYIKTKNDGISIEWSQFISEGKKCEDDFKNLQAVQNKTAVIMRSGGTSGKPKGVELTNYNIVSMIEQFALGVDNFDKGEKMLAVMPVFHGFGLVSSVLLPLAQGVGVILIPDPKKVDLVDTINKLKPEHILGVPTLFNALKNKVEKVVSDSKGSIKDFSEVLDLRKTKNLVSGGDADSIEKEKQMNDFFHKCGMPGDLKQEKGYGLTEVVAGVTFAAGEYNELGSCGIPMIKTNIKIIDSRTGNELGEGEVGEICVSSPSIMKGYYRRPLSTKKAIHEGWLHTGDLGFIKDGMLYFSQRKGDMIISSGYNIYPSNVEEVILQHPAIEKCVVIGKKDDYRGEVPKAFVIMKDGYELDYKIVQDIKKMCSEKLEKHAVPVDIEARTSFPETKLGKQSRALLKLEEDTKQLIALEQQQATLENSKENNICEDTMVNSNENIRGR